MTQIIFLFYFFQLSVYTKLCEAYHDQSKIEIFLAGKHGINHQHAKQDIWTIKLILEKGKDGLNNWLNQDSHLA